VARGFNVKSTRIVKDHTPRACTARELSPDTTNQLNGRMVMAQTSVNDNGLLATLAPIWQIVIGVCVLVVVVAASARLARRGRSRMTTALLITGAAVICLAVLGILTSGY
jgi:hypothetical protein